MSTPAIRVENLSKVYRIGAKEQEPQSRAGAFKRRAISPIAYLRRTLRPPREDEIFWALRDISFEVLRGEVMGIIGRNGAGKSTLLKILSRITEPTSGRAVINGRLASLLEVGTGFHPELTGRENIYMNGAIMGMRRSEIQRKFNEMVDFSGVEKFIDTPVKHYSSGMYVRLAFAVAAHLESEVLIVDEVLAVGDAEFQKKCLGKMENVAKQGRTVLYVSHNLASIQRLCSRCMLLEKGAIASVGPTRAIVESYCEKTISLPSERAWGVLSEAPGDEIVRLQKIRICDSLGKTVGTTEIKKPVGIEIEYLNFSSNHKPSAGIHVWNVEGVHLFASQDFNNKQWQATMPRPRGLIKATCWIPGNFLAEGRFLVTMTISSFSPALIHHAVAYEVVSFEVVDNSTGDGVRGPTNGAWPGLIRPMLDWEIQAQPQNIELMKSCNAD